MSRGCRELWGRATDPQSRPTLSPGSGPAGEVLAVLKVDNRVVGQTGWGPVARQSWDQTFVIPLERVRLALGRPEVTLGCVVEGQRAEAGVAPRLQPDLSDAGPRAGGRGALAGLATAVRRGLPAAGGLPGQCLSPADPQPGATGTALCPGAH